MYLRSLCCSVAAVSLLVPTVDAQESVPAATNTAPTSQQAVPLPPLQVESTAKPKVTKKKTAKKPTSPQTTVASGQPEAAPATTAPAKINQKSTMTPPAPYAGGQVATGGQLGMLGNRGVMDTPFNQTSYTAQTIQDQQARSVADILLNDPSVRATQNASAGYGQDTYYIRGFYYDIGEQGLNGLFGLAPAYTTIPNFIERIEVLKGPSALLNGMPPGGAVGGSINLVTKKAPDTPLTQVTTTYQSEGLFGTQLDFARRYGENKEWGVRFNGEYGAGDTAIEGQHNELGDAVLNLDYRGERLRFSADLGYQSNSFDHVQRFMTIAKASPSYASIPTLPPLAAVPPAPEAGSNYGVPWGYYDPTDEFATVQAEFDITKNITAYASYGWSKSNIDYLFTSPLVISSNGDWVSVPVEGSIDMDTRAGLVGVRAEIDTGPLNHLFNVSYSTIDRDSDTRAGNITGATCFALVPRGAVCSNIYHPVDVPLPTFASSNFGWAETDLSSIALSDTVSLLNDRVQLTVGTRRQTASSESLGTTGTYSTTDASVWSPAYALLVKPLRNVSLYANQIEGLQMGSTVQPPFKNAGEVLPPYQTKQREAGIKVDFGRISTTVAAFQIERPTVTTVGTTPNAYQTLGGEQRNRGVEINVFGELVPTVRVLGGVAFIDGRLTKTQGGTNDDHKAQGVADTNVNIGAEWDTPFPGLTVSGRVVYTSDSYINAANTYKIPDWTRYDLGARYTFASPFNGKPMTVRFGVENVANTSYYASSYNGDGIVTTGAPRTYLVSTTVNF